VFYEPIKLAKDKKKWRDWYQKNKCTITMQKADSLYEVNRNFRPNSD